MDAIPGTILSSSSLTGNDVVDSHGEKIGSISELMIDVNHGNVAYAVVSVGGFLGLGNKLFAVPFSAFTLDTDKHACVLAAGTKENFARAEGFDKDNWPKNSPDWGKRVHTLWGQRPYWQ